MTFGCDSGREERLISSARGWAYLQESREDLRERFRRDSFKAFEAFYENLDKLLESYELLQDLRKTVHFRTTPALLIDTFGAP